MLYICSIHKHIAMRYLVRSIKYFFWLIIFFAVIMLVLIFTGTSGGNMEAMFRGGYGALWKIALVFAAVAAIYPKVGFAAMPVATEDGKMPDNGTVRDYMEALGYIPETAADGTMTFRHRSTASRLSRMFEDRITFTATADGVIVEGLRKDVTRIASGLEHRLNNNMSNQ